MPSKPSILVLSESFERGGLEEFLRGQARDLQARGIESHLVTSSAVDVAAEDCFASVLPNQPLGLNATYAQFRTAWQDILAFARGRQVTHVHGHPFVTLIFAHLFAHGLRVPLALTLHGPVSLDWDYGPFPRVMFRNIVLPAAQTVCCVSPETQFLCRVLGRNSTVLTPNTARAIESVSSSPPAAAGWMWAGRIDVEKAVGLLDLVEKMRGLGKTLAIYGDGPHRSAVQQRIEADPELRAFVRFEGWSADLGLIYPRFEIVAGMGRVVIEAGSLGQPCLLVGYDGVKCLLDQETIEAAAYSNFSGRSFQNMPVEQLRELAESRPGRESAKSNLAAWFRENRNPDVVVESYIKQFSQSVFTEDAVTDALLQYVLRQAPADRLIFQDPFLIPILEGLAGSDVQAAIQLDRQKEVTAEVHSIHTRVAALAGDYERRQAVAKETTATLQTTLAKREKRKGTAMAREDHRHAQAALRQQSEARSSRISGLVNLTWRRATALLRVVSGAAGLTIRSPSLTIARLGVVARKVRRHGPVAALKWLSTRFGSGPAINGDEQFPSRYMYAPELPMIAPVPGVTAARPVSVATRRVRPYRSGLISIILPVYNQAGFLDDAIGSILKQTYANWELIIVNDGSTDDFEAKVAPYISDPRLRIFHQPNQKLPSALNNGFREARGEFFTWTSADNVVLENWLERLLLALQLNPNAGLAYSDYIAIDDRGAELDDQEWRRQNRPTRTARLHLPREVTTANFHDGGDNFLGASFMWRAEVHEVVGNHDENVFGGEDYDFWLRMNVVTPFTHVAEALYLYRVHDNTLNARAKDLKLLRNIRRLLDNDRDRRAALLLASLDLADASGRLDHWRDTRQYRPGATGASYLRYSQISSPLEPDVSQITVVRIDVPLREIDLKLVRQADILVTSDALSYCWLRRAPRDLRQRLLFVDEITGEAGLAHAVALRRFEKSREAKGYFLAQKPPARAAMFLPRHVLLAVGRWGNGGLEQVVVDLASRLIGYGVAVAVACCEGQPSREMRDVCAALGVEPVGFDGSPAKLLAYVRESGVDFVNYHHANLAVRELSEAGIRTVYTVHNTYVWLTFDEIVQLRSQLASIAEFVAVSRESAQYAHRWLGAPADRIHVIPNGVDLTSPRASLDRDGEVLPQIPQGYRFLNAAGFDRIKNQDKLIKAFASLAKTNSDVHLTLVGWPANPTFLKEIKALRRSLDLQDRVTIIEGTSRANVLQLMSTHDCFVLPSIVEGWSISLAEAILSGMTVVASDVGSARDVQSLSEAVVLVPGLADDLQAMHQAEMLALFRDSGAPFIDRLEAALRDVWVRRDALRQKAAEAVPLAQDLFSLDRALTSYLEMMASR